MPKASWENELEYKRITGKISELYKGIRIEISKLYLNGDSSLTRFASLIIETYADEFISEDDDLAPILFSKIVAEKQSSFSDSDSDSIYKNSTPSKMMIPKDKNSKDRNRIRDRIRSNLKRREKGENLPKDSERIIDEITALLEICNKIAGGNSPFNKNKFIDKIKILCKQLDEVKDNKQDENHLDLFGLYKSLDERLSKLEEDLNGGNKLRQYIHSIEDAVSTIFENLSDYEYDNLVEDDFDDLANILPPFGEQFVFLNSVHTLSLSQDEYTKNTLQIVSFVHPKQYLCIYFKPTGLYAEPVNSKEEVLERLHDFINNVTMLTFEQVDAINEIISAYK